MSEMMNAWNGKKDFHWQLLTTVSALALLAAVCTATESEAADQDTDRPTVWIELGGQAEHISGQGNPFTPAFLAANPHSPVLQSMTPLQAQNPSPFSFAEEGKISFQPEDSNWAFSVAVNYGRSSSLNHVDHQTSRVFEEPYGPTNTFLTTAADFAKTQAHRRESHAILDFAVGKDVGLGMFGKESSSVFSLGVRFAQFASSATFDARARPDLHVNYLTFGPVKIPQKYFHTYHATGNAARSFHGIGPSLSWNGSVPFVGNLQDGELAFDWGANAAVLFGRQRAHVRHQESGHAKSGGFNYAYSTKAYYNPVAGHDANRSVTVPNIGGFAGASWRLENFKASFGYRADFFFGAVDGGIDVRKSEMLSFYGPFANISIGLGG